MAELGVTERAPYDPAILGEPESRVTWMWRLTEEGKNYRFCRTRGAQPMRDARTKPSRPDDDTMDRMLKMMEGRNPMLCATIAREMGCRDSYEITGLLRRACKEGWVKRITRRGASYFALSYKG